MKRVGIISLFLLFGVVAGFIAFNYFQVKPQYTFVKAEGINIPIATQEATERRMKLYNISNIYTSGVTDSLVLYKPGLIKGDVKGNLYVVDYGDMLIKTVSQSNASLAAEYGGGRGEAPGEFGNISDIFIDNEHRQIWVADGSRWTVSKFDISGQLNETQKLETGIHRIAPIKDSRFYIMGMGTHLFSLYNSDGTEVVRFGSDILKDQLSLLISLDGHITPIEQDLVYLPQYYPLIVRFNGDGELVYARETINSDLSDGPTVQHFGKGMRMSNKKRLNTNIAHHDGRLYITAITEDSRGVIDIYDSGNGTYLHSYDLPFASTGREYAIGNYIYAYADTTVSIYHIDE